MNNVKVAENEKKLQNGFLMRNSAFINFCEKITPRINSRGLNLFSSSQRRALGEKAAVTVFGVKAVVQAVLQYRANTGALFRGETVVRQHYRLRRIKIYQKHTAYLKSAKERIERNGAALFVIRGGNFHLVKGEGDIHFLADNGIGVFGVFEYSAFKLGENQYRPNQKSDEDIPHKSGVRHQAEIGAESAGGGCQSRYHQQAKAGSVAVNGGIIYRYVIVAQGGGKGDGKFIHAKNRSLKFVCTKQE